MKKTPPTLKEAKFLPKKITQNNVKKEITKAIKKVARANLVGLHSVPQYTQSNNARATGLWGHAIKIETTKGKPVYPVSYDVGKWCLDRDFPLPKNEEEENKIKTLSDFRFYILRREFTNFINDLFEILTGDRAILFYLGMAMGVIFGFSVYHYYF